MATLRIGNKVTLPDGSPAILRWMGRVRGKSLEYAGVELLGPEATLLGKHSGEFEGIKYFDVEVPGTGLFVSFTKLLSSNVQTSFDAFSDNGLVPVASTASLRQRSDEPESPMRTGSSNLSNLGVLSPIDAESVDLNMRMDRLPTMLGVHDVDTRHASYYQELYERLEDSDKRAQYLRKELDERRKEFRATVSELEQQLNQTASAYEARIRQLVGRLGVHDKQSTDVDLVCDADFKTSNLRQSGIVQADVYNPQDGMERSSAIEEVNSNINDELSRVKEECEQLKIKLKIESDKNETLVNCNANLRKTIKDLESQDESKGLNDAVCELTEKLRKLEAETDEIRAKLMSSQKMNKDLNLKLESLKGNKESMEVRDSEFCDIKKLKEQHAASLNRVNELEEECSRLESALEARIIQGTELEAEVERLKLLSHASHKNHSTGRNTESALAPIPEVLESNESAEMAAEYCNNTKSAKMYMIANLEKATLVENLERSMTQNDSGSASSDPNIIQSSSSLVNAAAGREEWCALCERLGHNTLECPYET